MYRADFVYFSALKIVYLLLATVGRKKVKFNNTSFLLNNLKQCLEMEY